MLLTTEVKYSVHCMFGFITCSSIPRAITFSSKKNTVLRDGVISICHKFRHNDRFGHVPQLRTKGIYRFHGIKVPPVLNISTRLRSDYCYHSQSGPNLVGHSTKCVHVFVLSPIRDTVSRLH